MPVWGIAPLLPQPVSARAAAEWFLHCVGTLLLENRGQEKPWISIFQTHQLYFLDFFIGKADVPKVCARSFQNKPLFLPTEENKCGLTMEQSKWLGLFPCCPNNFMLIYAMRLLLLFFPFYLHVIASQVFISGSWQALRGTSSCFNPINHVFSIGSPPGCEASEALFPSGASPRAELGSPVIDFCSPGEEHRLHAAGQGKWPVSPHAFTWRWSKPQRCAEQAGSSGEGKSGFGHIFFGFFL